MLTLAWHCTECPGAGKAEGMVEGGREGCRAHHGMLTWRMGLGADTGQGAVCKAQREADKTSNPN